MENTRELPFVFLICSERSGSNFILRLFDAHPEFCGPAPAHLVRHLCDHVLHYGDLGKDSNWRALLDDTFDLFDSKVAVWRSRWTRDELHESIKKRSLGALVRTIHEREARAAGKTRLFVKENHTARYVPFLLNEFPAVRFVYLVRDPRDMALSWKLTRELRGEVCRATSVWRADQTDGLRLLGQLGPAGRIAQVRYEDLVDFPERELKRLCAFLEVDYAPTMLDFHQSPVTRENAAATRAWENLGRPVMAGNHGKFKTGLSKDEIRYVEWKLSEECSFFDYLPTLSPPDDGPTLEAHLMAIERMDKAAYQDVPETERRARQRQREILDRMARHRPA